MARELLIEAPMGFPSYPAVNLHADDSLDHGELAADETEIDGDADPNEVPETRLPPRKTGTYAHPEDTSVAVPAPRTLRFEKRRRRLVDAAAFSLPIIAGAIFIGSLKATAMVTLPLAIAAFLVILTWPVHSALAARTHRVVAVLGTLATLGVIVASFVGLLYWAMKGFIANIEMYTGALRAFAKKQAGVFPGLALTLDPDPEQAREMARGALRTFFVSASAAFLTTMFTVFAVSEAGRWRKRLHDVLEDRRPGLIGTLGDVTQRFRRYMWTRVLMSLLTGGGTMLTCWAFGVADAPLWGVVAFLLNFIPNIGSLVAVVPPTLVALAQGGGAYCLSVLAVLTLVQVTIGQWLEPLVQGRTLRISPLVVLLSVVFWGWVWGIGGALLSVPMTVLFISLASRSRKWSWIAELVTDSQIDDDDEPNIEDSRLEEVEIREPTADSEANVGPGARPATAGGVAP